MKQEELGASASALLQADKAIYERCLRKPWTKPVLEADFDCASASGAFPQIYSDGVHAFAFTGI